MKLLGICDKRAVTDVSVQEASTKNLVIHLYTSFLKNVYSDFLFDNSPAQLIQLAVADTHQPNSLLHCPGTTSWGK